MTTGSSESSKPSKWYLAPFLTFLDTVPQERITTSNMYDTDANENSGSDLSDEEVNITDEVPLSPETQFDQSISPSMSGSRKMNKRKNVNITELLEKRSKERTQLMTQICSKENTVDDDDVDHFFKSLVISVKKLPPHLIAQAKLKMLTVLTDLQFHDPGNRYTTPISNRVLITPSQSTTSSTHSLENHYTPYNNYSPPSISSPSYTNTQQQLGSSNTLTPFDSVANMNNEWNTNSQ